MPRLRGVNQELIDELRRQMMYAEPFHLTFEPCIGMSSKHKQILEDSLRRRFRQWVYLNVLPLINKIEKKLIRTKKDKA